MSASTRDSIARFIEEISWTARARLIEPIAAQYAEGELEETERQSAEELFRLGLYDGEPLVRRVLAETLKHATALPRDIVLALAHDVIEVSSPFLTASPLLADADLVAIVAGGGRAHGIAVATRRPLSAPVAEAVARHGGVTALRFLLANEEAAIDERSLHAILDRVVDPGMFLDAIARRRVLPVGILARLVAAHRRRNEAPCAALPLLAGPTAQGVG